MRIYIILFFLPLLFLISCKDEKAAGILSHEDMQAVLVDVHIVDGTLFEVPAFPDSLYKYSFSKYQRVFDKHHTDSAQFRKSFIYYTGKPDELFDIYEKVVPVIKVKADSAAKVKRVADSLENKKQQKINEVIAKRAADSIKRINNKKLKADSLKKKKNKPDSTVIKKKRSLFLERAKKFRGKNAISRQ
ncbi:DUF4296 domain-containing protein [Mucilaginibacter galii]|uniref:DUF4296 domain-containing protein n=1 Tax=Mucilaginibacter galii TaxID=2005073 RepID=A0A917N350_9SPHI|nr:DUF4296 domain-containing protein [Mucilaginibacter galii]GGI52790.1 hypothetical protein GCM10011425_40020 [Mucilaginibacter galii]